MPRERLHVDQGVVLWREDGGPWYLDLCQNGVRTRRSLRTRHKGHAMQIAKEHAAAFTSGRWNVRLAAGMTLADAVERFADEYEGLHHAPTTRTYTRMVFARLLDFLKRRHAGHVPLIDAVRPDDLIAFQRELVELDAPAGGKVSASTVNRHLREVSTLMQWAMTKGAVRTNPCDPVKPLRGIKRLRQPLTEAELDKLKPRLGERLGDLVAVLLATGLRLGEATHLRADDVDVAGAKVVVRSRPDYPIKDREEREVPVDGDEARAALARRRLAAGPSTRPPGSLGGAGGLLFANSRGRVPDARDLLRELHRAAHEAGIRRVDFYLLRHTYATEMARKVMPYELAARMGHSDVRTANRYYVHLGRRADAV
jgi:integrase